MTGRDEDAAAAFDPLRWLDADRAATREPEAFLRRVVTRLCLDQLKSAQRRRETYLGLWLPEPVVEAPEDQSGGEIDVTLPLLLALERLSPLERAAFLMHDVFGLGFEEIAATIDRAPAACRQLASRARTHVRAARPRFPVPEERGLEIAAAFFAASRDSDMARLRSLLADDVAVHAGGGRVPAALELIVGLDAGMRPHARRAASFAEGVSRLVRHGLVNGLPGFVTIEQDSTLQTTALQIEDGRIVAIYMVRNPDKLRHLNGHVLQ